MNLGFISPVATPIVENSNVIETQLVIAVAIIAMLIFFKMFTQPEIKIQNDKQ